MAAAGQKGAVRDLETKMGRCVAIGGDLLLHLDSISYISFSVSLKIGTLKIFYSQSWQYTK